MFNMQYIIVIPIAVDMLHIIPVHDHIAILNKKILVLYLIFTN